MKLFVLYNPTDERIIAFSDNKKLIYSYIIQNNFTDYLVSKIKDQNMIDKLIIVEENLLLQEFEGFILTTGEIKVVNKMLSEEKQRLIFTISDLSHMVENYNFSKKERKNIEKTINILKYSTTSERFYIILMIKDFIRQILGIEKTNIKKLFNQINEMDDYYDIKIK